MITEGILVNCWLIHFLTPSLLRIFIEVAINHSDAVNSIAQFTILGKWSGIMAFANVGYFFNHTLTKYTEIPLPRFGKYPTLKTILKQMSS